MDAPTLRFVGPVPVDERTLAQTIEIRVQIPGTAAGSLPISIPAGIFQSRNPVLEIESVSVIPAAELAIDGTDTTTIALTNRGLAGAGTDVLASISNASAKLEEYVENALTMVRTVAAPASGSVLSVDVTKDNSGTAIPNCVVIIRFRQ